MTLPLHRQLESQSGATDGGFGLEMVYRGEATGRQNNKI